MIIHSQVFVAKIQGKKNVIHTLIVCRFAKIICKKQNNQEQKQQTAKPKRTNNNKTK